MTSKPSPSGPGNIRARRQAVAVTPQALSDLVRFEPLSPDVSWPWVARPTVPSVDLASWASANRRTIDEYILRYGTVLFRGFNVVSVAAFRCCAKAMGGELIDYRFRASPRGDLADQVYTSTDYPADQSIFPHNEHAYSPVAPQMLYFGCLTPADSGGATPIGDNRQVTARIDMEIRRRFVDKGILYRRNYGRGFGLPWQAVFQTNDPASVEAYCREVGIHWEWRPDGHLCTWQVGSAIVRHPTTAETVWFNHATFFHITTLSQPVRDALLSEFPEEDLPQQTYYGDGSPIELDVLETLRGIYRDVSKVFAWERGDVLAVDNLLTVHGREPYTGPRLISVAMAKPFAVSDHAEKEL